MQQLQNQSINKSQNEAILNKEDDKNIKIIISKNINDQQNV